MKSILLWKFMRQNYSDALYTKTEVYLFIQHLSSRVLGL